MTSLFCCDINNKLAFTQYLVLNNLWAEGSFATEQRQRQKNGLATAEAASARTPIAYFVDSIEKSQVPSWL